MTTAAVPEGGRSLLGRLAASWAPHPRRVRRRKLAVAASRAGRLAADHVLTVAALTALDLGAFEASRIWGWLALCPCLLVLDFKLRG